MHFIAQQLPSAGIYCAAQAIPNAGYIQRFFDTTPALIAHIETQDAAGHTMYLAQASFKTSDNRKAVNALYLRNFFFDVDCGEAKFAATPDKAYPTQKEGCEAIALLAKILDLPLPSVVNSGNGLYAHWIIDEDIPADKWKVMAGLLKRIAAAAGFRQDPSRTADASSVLRPVGTTNRKGDPKPVTLLKLANPISLTQFVTALEVASKKYKIDAAVLQPPTQFKGLNDDFTAGIAGPEASLLKVAENCAQVRKVRDTQGNVDEPTWYNFLGMARHTSEGKEVVILHEWSKGHPDYSPEATIAKVRQLEAGGFGPTTCAKFGSDNPSGCLACPHANSTKSPITLGRPDPVSIATEEEELCAPEGFKRSIDGLHYWDDKWFRFHPYDIYIENIAFDPTQGFEVATIKHKMPLHTEYAQFNIRTANLHDPKALLMALGDNHIQTTGGESRKQMINYIDGALAQMRANRKLANLHSQMGWSEVDGLQAFVLGDTLYRKNQSPTLVGFAKNVPEAARSFKAQGDLGTWTKTTELLGLSGMEPFAFAFLAGAFGAPLMRFTGFAGAMVALIGDSGIGKTLLGEWIMSVYGDSQRLILLKDDTKNFLVQRLGLYGSLPLYVDEISNIEGQELSDLVYKITQGRDKGRLSKSGVEKVVINSWNTIAVATSNHSLVDKLSALKLDASAEINRIMELSAASAEGFGRATATQAYHTFHENFGVAGPAYIAYITDHQEQHRAKIDILVNKICLDTQAIGEERFWTAIAGTAIYGGLIAQKLGLINFAVTPLLEWVNKHIVSARETKIESVTTYSDMLGQFLDAHLRGTMVTTGNGPKEMVAMPREPTGPLVCRINQDTDRLFISRSALRTYLDKTFGSYSKLRTDLEKSGALLSTDKRMVLGRGTYFSGSQQPVWEIDLRCPALGNRTLGIVRDINSKKVANG